MEYNQKEFESYKEMASAVGDVLDIRLDKMPAVYKAIEQYMKAKGTIDKEIHIAVFPCMQSDMPLDVCVDLLQGTLTKSELEEQIAKVQNVLSRSKDRKVK